MLRQRAGKNTLKLIINRWLCILRSRAARACAREIAAKNCGSKTVIYWDNTAAFFHYERWQVKFYPARKWKAVGTGLQWINPAEKLWYKCHSLELNKRGAGWHHLFTKESIFYACQLVQGFMNSETWFNSRMVPTYRHCADAIFVCCRHLLS